VHPKTATGKSQFLLLAVGPGAIIKQTNHKIAMRAFTTKEFHIWATKEGLSSAVLANAVREITDGLIGDSLGGNVYKKRVKLPGRGKSGGARTLIAYKAAEKLFFTFGFAKKERENIDSKELKAIKELANELFDCTDRQLDELIKIGALKEIQKEVRKND
jgi:hypothetical protein